jgi:hypothetical protein
VCLPTSTAISSPVSQRLHYFPAATEPMRRVAKLDL